MQLILWRLMALLGDFGATFSGDSFGALRAIRRLAGPWRRAGRDPSICLDVAKGRVVYLAIENPDDTVSRFAIAQQALATFATGVLTFECALS